MAKEMSIDLPPDRPFRKVRPNTRSVTGIFITRSGKPLEFESQLERDSYLILDFEPNVEDIAAQPLRICNWVPDCLISSENEKILVEIKYESELIAKWPELSERYSFLSDEVKKEGFLFGVITDSSVYYPEVHRVHILKMIKALATAKHIPNRIQSEVKEAVLTQGSATIGELASTIGLDSELPSRIGMICTVLSSGPPYALKVPTAKLLECLISLPESNAFPLNKRVLGFEELQQRIRTQPFRGLEGGLARVVS